MYIALYVGDPWRCGIEEQTPSNSVVLNEITPHKFFGSRL